MSLPTTIRASVSPSTIDKVGRLFNGGPTDVLNELLQNARRASASRVAIEVLELDCRPTLRVSDDGLGIDDPALLLCLGQSTWNELTIASEDPAGMGVFAMAGLRVEYRSYSRTAGEGWRVAIDADAWSGSHALTVEPFAIELGTEVLIEMPASWGTRFEGIVDEVARYYPLPVTFEGSERARRDWLADALHVETWRGSRIGVLHEAGRYLDKTLNFHGLTVPLGLPSVGEAGRGRRWCVRVDIGDTPELQLVLPARKEVVQTPFIADLKQACEVAIYRAIAKTGGHRLGFGQYSRAHALGIALPEAEPRLHAWSAGVAEPIGREQGSETSRPMTIMMDLEPAMAQTVRRALELAGERDEPLVDPEPKFAGYAWYDALDRVIDTTLKVSRDGIEHLVNDGDEDVELPSGRVDRLSVELTIERSDGTSDTEVYPTDVAIVQVDPYESDLDTIALLVAPDATIGEHALVALLVCACFSPSDDRESDSYETQLDRFDRAALTLARTHLVGEEAALLGSALDRVRDHIQWMVPADRTLLIAVRRDGIGAAFQDRPPAYSDEEAFTRRILAHAMRAFATPEQAMDAVADIRVECHERALDLMAIAARARAAGG